MESHEASSDIEAHSKHLRTTVAYWRGLRNAMPKSEYRNNNLYSSINAQTAFEVLSPADKASHLARISPTSSLSSAQQTSKR